ncbi:MAG TPA: glycosyltransferase [Nitriliruptorales bacterium]|nr:glycosyltransferase [Nitriliruptorales bacterium]
MTLVFATAIERDRFPTAPLTRSLRASPPGSGELHALDLGGGPADSEPGLRWWTIDDLGLPARSVRFALDREQLVALCKPRFLRLLCRALRRSVVFVDAGCLVRDPRPLVDPLPDGLELLPSLHSDLLRLKPSLRAGLEAGASDPTSAVVRVGRDETVDGLLDRWVDWMLEAYVEDPTRSLVAAEIDLLRSLPAQSPAARWRHTFLYVHWSDIPGSLDLPAVVDTGGFDRYATASGPALDLIERRTHSGRGVRWVREQAWEPAPPATSTFLSGAAVPEVTAAVLRALDPMGARWTDPFDDTGDDTFVAWLRQTDGRGVTRFAHALYWSRRDLRESFPARSTPARVFSDWLRSTGTTPTAPPSTRPQRSSPPRQVLPVLARRARRLIGRGEVPLAGPREPAPISVPGVNLVGFARAESGLGEALRATAGALSRSQVPTAVVDVSGRVYSRQAAPAPVGTAIGTPFDVTIFHLNPEEMIGYATDSLAYRFAPSWNIGFWFWETEEPPPSWRAALDAVDEVWVATSFVGDVFRRHTGKPVSVLGLPVDPPAEVRAERERWELPRDAFVVSYVTDAYSGLQRKDPMAALQAFTAAYAPSFDDVHLVLKVSNLEKFPSMWTRLDEASRGLPVTVIGEYLPRADLWDLLAASDAYLSLHASEGFGLTIAEAMALEIPCVVTAYGGNMDFTDESSALLVPFQRVPAEGGPGDVYAGRGTWAKPDVEVAAQHLRSLRDAPDLRQRLGRAGRQRIAAYRPERFTARVLERLAAIGLPR